jgi:hypothetical protein
MKGYSDTSIKVMYGKGSRGETSHVGYINKAEMHDALGKQKRGAHGIIYRFVSENAEANP